MSREFIHGSDATPEDEGAQIRYQFVRARAIFDSTSTMVDNLLEATGEDSITALGAYLRAGDALVDATLLTIAYKIREKIRISRQGDQENG